MKEFLKQREERIKLLIQIGYTGDIETGKIYNKFGKEVLTKNDEGYLKISTTINKKSITIRQHQFIYYLATGEIVEMLDHINCNKSDNRISNLRKTNHIDNGKNQLNVKGYTWDKTNNKWKSQIVVNKKQIYLGLFETELEANKAYLKAKEKYHIIN